MECFLVFYAKSTGTQLAARHQNVPFQGSIFVMLAVPSEKQWNASGRCAPESIHGARRFF
jgi:hypothetical protein